MSKSISIREQQRIFTRSQLKEAARDIFAQKGYQAATVDDIASAAGASRATFYLHFSSKERIAAEMIEDTAPFVLGRYQELDEVLTSSEDNKKSRLRDWLEGWVEYWRTNGSLLHAQIASSMADPDRQRESLALGFTYLDAMPGFFESLTQQRRGEVRAHAFLLELMTRFVLDATARSLLEVPDAVVLDYLTQIWSDVFLPES
jgi:AcrR family transcriptional regulator